MESHLTLIQAVKHFDDFENCRKFMTELRWPDGVVKCPRCGSDHVVYLANQRKWKCYEKHSQPTFTLKTGTVFEDSPIPLGKWIVAVWQITNCKNGISSWELHRALGVTQKTAWFMLHRVRLGMQDDLTGGMLSGVVEVDESFIGGKIRNMHKDRKVRAQKVSQKGDKSIVLGIIERASKGKQKRVRATVINDRKAASIRPEVAAHIEPGSTVYSDEFGGNWNMPDRYIHESVNHAIEYVNGNVHTNSAENFWSLLKRGLNGTYISVEPYHLFRYIDEQAFRFNTRLDAEGEVISDYQRFTMAMSQIVGKRLTYKQLTGKVEERPEAAN